jgi:hypothetical protein
MLLSKLPCQHLTEEMKEKLTQRGKLYHDLAGVHYKTCMFISLQRNNKLNHIVS